MSSHKCIRKINEHDTLGENVIFLCDIIKMKYFSEKRNVSEIVICEYSSYENFSIKFTRNFTIFGNDFKNWKGAFINTVFRYNLILIHAAKFYTLC